LRSALDIPINVVPAVLIDPVSRILFLLDIARRSREQVPIFQVVKLIFSLQDLDQQHEAEEQLVLLEQGAADILVQREGEVIIQVEKSLFKLLCRRRVLHAHNEQIDEPLERVLVHRVNSVQVNDAEEKN